MARDPPMSGGCVLAIAAMIGLVALPFVARFLPVAPGALWSIGVVLGLVVVVGWLHSVFGGALTRGSAISDVDEAVEQLLDAFPHGDPAVMRDAAVRILTQYIVSSGPTSVAGFDPDEVRTRLGDAFGYVVEVEKVLLEAGEIYSCFTQRDAPIEYVETSSSEPAVDRHAPNDITDIWFRTELSLVDVARGIELADPSEDTESYWAWVIGRVAGVEIDITRTHRRPAGEVDTRIFLVARGPIPDGLKAMLLGRLRSVVSGPIWCGRWVYRWGNEFDRVVVEEHLPE